MTGRSLRFAVSLVLALTWFLMAARAASACSCAGGEPRDRLVEADAALVGTVTDRSGGLLDVGTVTVTIAVEHDLKGNLGDEVQIETNAQGSACGLELGEGARTGLFLTLEGDHWTSSLCQQIDPETLLKAAEPLPEPTGEGPVRFLVGGNFGEARVLALDARGRTLAYGWGDGHVYDLQVCPGGRLAVESVSADRVGALVVRDVTTMAVIRQIEIVRTKFPSIYEVACLDADANHLLAIEEAGREVRVHEVNGEDARIVFSERGDAWGNTIEDGVPYLSLGRELGRVDVATGTWIPIAELPPDVWGARLSPDGRWVAGTRYGGALPGEPPSDIVVFPVDGGPMRSIPMVGWNDGGYVHWLSSDRLLFTPVGEDVNRIAIYDVPSMTEVVGADDWYADEVVITDDVIYGVEFGRLVQVRLGEDSRTRTFAPIDGEVYAFDDVPGELLSTPSPAPPSSSESPASAPGSSGGTSGSGPVLTAVMLLGVLGLATLGLSRRLGRRPSHATPERTPGGSE